MKNIFFAGVFGGLLLLTGVFSSVSATFVQVNVTTDAYCASSSICGTTSKPLSLLMDFVNEMLNAIHTQGTEGAYIGKYVNPNRFKGSKFSPPSQTIASKISRNVSQKLTFLAATTAIFSNPVNIGGLKDIGGGVVILTKNKVFFRDLQLIEALEYQLITKKYELGLGGGWYETVNDENLAIMRSILQKYIDAGIFAPGSQINVGVFYNNITSMLTSMLSAAKSFLYFDTISQFDQISRGGIDGVRILFDPAAMSVLRADYSCARGITNPCDNNLKQFKQTISTLISSTKNSWSDSLNIFINALERLEQTFSSSEEQSSDFKAREQELLKSLYGTTHSTRTGLRNFLQYSDNIDSEDISVSSLPRLWKSSVDKTSRSSKEKLENIQKKTSVDTLSSDAFVALINGYLSDVFVSQEVDKEITFSSEIKDITPAFTALGMQIQTIKEDILGDSRKENSLLKNLDEAARLQCSR